MRVTSGAQQDSPHIGNISWGRLGDVVEAEASLSGVEIIWFGVSERGFKMKTTLHGALKVNG